MPLLPGSPPVEITLRRSAQTRRFSLRISRLDGRVTLSMPLRARESEALRFAQQQEGWIRQTLAEMPGQQQVGLGDQIPVEGRLCRLMAGQGRSVRCEGDALLVPGDPQQAGTRVGAFLKVLARDRLAAACDRHAARLGQRYTRLTLRDTRSRWGSCAHDGALMFSWRLIMAPPPVLDYVAAHEVAHLIEMNHSPAYWAVVERVFPGWQVQRNWLHNHGQALHGYRFGPVPAAKD
ncbi:M48 family metallopeptidase [Pseudotabrizicola sp. L79]|uniref:M48 family metallopeptidase n=1 Tax=Pseudotabrizicola sp. L79 TaxID=3118402 RepID=UPI002F951A4D